MADVLDDGEAPWLRPAAPDPKRERVQAELDRVGASYSKAGAADCVSLMFRSDGVKLNGPPREHPPRSWLGPERELIELLAVPPDDAGTEAVWRVLAAL